MAPPHPKEEEKAVSKSAANSASSIPRYPTITAILYEDATGTISFDKRSGQISAAHVGAAREVVLEHAAWVAETLGRPVRLNCTDPDGAWQVAVHPDGRVEELPPTATVAGATPGDDDRETGLSDEQAPTVGLAPARRISHDARRWLMRLSAVIALLAIVASATALVLSGGGPAKVASNLPAAKTSSPLAIKERADAAAIAQAVRTAERRAAAQRRRDRATADKRATDRTLASAKRADRRRARNRRAAGRRVAAASQRRVATPRPPAAQVAPPPPPVVNQRPAPPPPPPSTCGDFDIC